MFKYIMKKFHKKFFKFKILIIKNKLKVNGAIVGNNLKIFGDVIVYKEYNLELKDNISLNQGVLINCMEKVLIGNNCHLSAYSQIHTGYLDLKDLNRKHKSKPIILEDNCWVCSGVIVGAGVTIGENSVIGANSVVLDDVEKNSFYAGSPARKIKDLNL